MPNNDQSVKVKRTRSASDAVKKFTAWWEFAEQHHHTIWNDNWKAYNNQRVYRSYQGATDTYVPMPYSIIETATAALASGRPSIDFVPQDMFSYAMSYAQSGKKPDLKALNAKFDYFWDCDNWDIKTVVSIRNGFLNGIMAEWIYWDSDKPRIINLGPRDIILDPNMSHPMQLITNPNDYYSGRRYLTTKASLASEKIVDPASGKIVKRYKDLSQVHGGGGQAELTEKEQKELFLGATGETKNLVEVIEIVTGETIKTVANRSVVIEERENKLGIHFLALGRFINNESTIVGKSLLEPILKNVEYVNDMSNQKQDYITDGLRPMSELDPLYKDHTEAVAKAKFGSVFPFMPGSLRPIPKDRIDSSVFAEIETQKNEIREAVGIDQIVQGVGDTGNATATEINAQMSQAGQRFSLFVRMLERELLYHRAKIVYKMMRHYADGVDLVPVQTMAGPQFRQFDPSQFDDTYEPRIQLESSVKAKKARDSEQYRLAYEMMIADPTNNLWEVKKVMYPKMMPDMTEEELDRIIGQQAPQQAPAGMTDPITGEPLPTDPMADPVADPMADVAPEVMQ